MKIVCVSGDRRATYDGWHKVIERAFDRIGDIDTVVHGGCSGIDMICDKIARQRGYNVVVYRAEWNVYGRAAGPIRNKLMIQHLLNYDDVRLLAFHPDIESSRGTKNMIELAVQYNIAYQLYSV
jgi:hypothetical protein